MKITDLKDYHVVSTRPPSTRDTSNNVTEFAQGALKGFTRGAIDVARVANSAAELVNPSFKAINDASGNNPLRTDTQDAKQIDQTLQTNNPAEKAGDIAQLVGTILFPVGKVGVAKAAATFEGIGSRISSLGDDAGIRERLIDLVSNIDDKTKTALQRTPLDRFQEFVKKGRDAMLDDRNRTPLESVGDDVARALQYVKSKLQTIGSQKGELSKINGIQGYSRDLLTQTRQKLQSFLNSRDLIEEDASIVKPIVERFKALGDSPSVNQVDRFIDFAQSKLYAGDKNLTVSLTSKTKGALKEIIGQLNDGVKNKMPETYRQLNDEYSRLIEFVEELNTKLGKDSGNAGSLVKRLFSPSDARTKELFDLLGKETGQDFFRDARLAKFVMDALGDVRQKSLLDMPTDASGLIGKAIDFAKEKIADPIDAAERYIRRKGPTSMN